MEIPGIGEKMVDKIYQAVNRFYEGGGEAAAAGEGGETAEAAEAEAGAKAKHCKKKWRRKLLKMDLLLKIPGEERSGN